MLFFSYSALIFLASQFTRSESLRDAMLTR
jgi:hypothetical protein